jgi:hypothetical protein
MFNRRTNVALAGNDIDINRYTMKKTDEKLKKGMWDIGRKAMLKHHDFISNVSMIDNKYPRCKSCTKLLSQLELEQSKCTYCGRSC